jgi:ubiquinone biosynthesis protein
MAARIARRFWRKGRRLRPVELVAEFEHTLIDELDLVREASNASQLRRNFACSDMMYVPKIYWPYVHSNVMVMERIHGIRVSDIATLKASGTDLKKLAEYGVEIFFTHVLRDSFFHADMHPGNIFVDNTDPQNPKYIGVDFGIMGTLSPEDQRYLAANLHAFFKRNYRQVAILHVESGWVPADTRVDQFESAIRAVCEPIFERPLKDISFGSLLLHLFRTAERFNMEVQPQLMLLQKTLLAIEGLGRELYPDLDLWETGKPYVEKWIRKQYSLKNLAKKTAANFPEIAEKIVETPQLLHDVLKNIRWQQQRNASKVNIPEFTINTKRIFLLGIGTGFLIITLGVIIADAINHVPVSEWNWLPGGFAAACLLVGWALPTKIFTQRQSN